jgi:glycine C-acetyltransferase
MTSMPPANFSAASPGTELNLLETASVRASRDLVRDQVLNWLRTEGGQPDADVEFDTPLAAAGVDSMGVAAISESLEHATGKRFNPEVLYELNTVEQIARYLDRLSAAPVTNPNAQSGHATRAPQSMAPSDTVTAAMASPSSPGSIASRFSAPQPTIPSAAVTTPPSVPAERHSVAASAVAGSGAVMAHSQPKLLEHYELMNQRIRSLKERNLYFFEPEIEAHDGAWVVIGGRRMLMLGSYEYLGLLHHPRLRESAVNAIESFGTGHHGVRLLCGTTVLHRRLERKLASFMRAEDAIVYSSGFMTNLATVSTLVDRQGVVIGDEWNHASIVDGCRASHAEFLIFKHNDIDSLASQLARAAGRPTLVVVDAVFSMDGDIIDLPAVIDLCKKHQALLMVDEAHSLGVLGSTGHGIQEHFGLADDDIDVKMGTLSKTLAGSGGFVAGRESIITFLRHHARGYIFSGALPTAQVNSSIAALEVIEQEPEWHRRLWVNREYYVAGLRALGFDIGLSQTPIVPIITRDDERVLEMTRLCRDAGLLVVPVAFPAVPRNASRLRTCVSSSHSREDLDFALDVLAQAGRQTGLIAPG